MGVSRAIFYRYQELVETDGSEGLINRKRRYLILKTVLTKAQNKLSADIHDTYSKVVHCKLCTTIDSAHK
ncbi:hypothetical protein NTGHW29_920040 [Candidatus Nitrotoga sp. HW29]|nr:hypothetical protein NTGHW29_920040 [Candidatus Nitrotoga sp. HW29]